MSGSEGRRKEQKRTLRNNAGNRNRDEVKSGSDSESEQDMDEVPCHKCKSKSTQIYRCGSCKQWVCISCEKMPKGMFNALEKYPRFRVDCSSCEENPTPTNVPVAEVSTAKVEEIMERTMANMVSGLKKQLEEVVSDGKAQLKQSYAEVARDFTRVTGTITTIVDKKLPREATEEQTHKHQAEIIENVDEYIDREKRKLNLIVHNVKEPEGVNQVERVKNDTETFDKIIKGEFNLRVKVSRAVRLGKKQEGKNRLLLVTVGNFEEEKDLLRLAKNIQQSDEWSNIYISPDLTPKEREVNRVLRAEIRRRRDAGESNLVIRNGKIIKTTREVRVQEQAVTVPNQEQAVAVPTQEQAVAVPAQDQAAAAPNQEQAPTAPTQD